jgi:hypothetical protein
MDAIYRTHREAIISLSNTVPRARLRHVREARGLRVHAVLLAISCVVHPEEARRGTGEAEQSEEYIRKICEQLWSKVWPKAQAIVPAMAALMS